MNLAGLTLHSHPTDSTKTLVRFAADGFTTVEIELENPVDIRNLEPRLQEAMGWPSYRKNRKGFDELG